MIREEVKFILTCDRCGASREHFTCYVLYTMNARRVPDTLPSGWTHDGVETRCPACNKKRKHQEDDGA